MLDDLEIEVSKTRNGLDYVQIRSPAAIPVNVVLVAPEMSVQGPELLAADCHCAAGTGLPLAAAVNVALALYVTV